MDKTLSTFANCFFMGEFYFIHSLSLSLPLFLKTFSHLEPSCRFCLLCFLTLCKHFFSFPLPFPLPSLFHFLVMFLSSLNAFYLWQKLSTQVLFSVCLPQNCATNNSDNNNKTPRIFSRVFFLFFFLFS